MFKNIEEIRITPAGWLKTAIYACVITFVYYTALNQLILHDWSREDYSYCIIIPFIVFYLVWEKRRELGEIEARRSWNGFITFIFGIFLFWIGELGGEYFTLYVSLWFTVIGLLWLHLGWKKIKTIWFALIMMLAMFPFPSFINYNANLKLRLLSSQIGVWLLHLIRMSAYREGNVIDIGFTRLQVVDACSGLRYVLPLMILGLLLAYWFKANFWKRAVLFLSSIPLAIFINSFRIAATGVLYRFFGAEVAEGFFHGFSGWIIFMFSIPILLLEMWILKEIGVEGSRGQGVEGKEVIKTWKPRNLETSKPSTLISPIFLTTVAILVLTFGLSHGIEFRQKVPVARSFSEFPMEVGEWSGIRGTMDQEIIDTLDLSDYVMTNYKNSSGRYVNFYVAYYESQRKGESIHSPETCLPGGGWEFKDAGVIKVPLFEGDSSMPVSRSFMEKAGERQLVYYWFPVRGRILTNLYQLKIYTFWDSLTRQRTDGALVRIITPVYEGEEVKDADARLIGFARDVAPVLALFLPE